MAASTPGKGSPKRPGREPWRGLRWRGGGGLGEAVALADPHPGAGQPAGGGDWMQGVGAAADELEPPPVPGRVFSCSLSSRRGGDARQNTVACQSSMASRMASRSGVVKSTWVWTAGDGREHHHHLPVDVGRRAGRRQRLLASVSPTRAVAKERVATRLRWVQHPRPGVAGGAAGVGQGGQVHGRVDVTAGRGGRRGGPADPGRRGRPGRRRRPPGRPGCGTPWPRKAPPHRLLEGGQVLAHRW